MYFKISYFFSFLRQYLTAIKEKLKLLINNIYHQTKIGHSLLISFKLIPFKKRREWSELPSEFIRKKLFSQNSYHSA